MEILVLNKFFIIELSGWTSLLENNAILNNNQLLYNINIMDINYNLISKDWAYTTFLYKHIILSVKTSWWEDILKIKNVKDINWNFIGRYITKTNIEITNYLYYIKPNIEVNYNLLQYIDLKKEVANKSYIDPINKFSQFELWNVKKNNSFWWKKKYYFLIKDYTEIFNIIKLDWFIETENKIKLVKDVKKILNIFDYDLRFNFIFLNEELGLNKRLNENFFKLQLHYFKSGFNLKNIIIEKSEYKSEFYIMHEKIFELQPIQDFWLNFLKKYFIFEDNTRKLTGLNLYLENLQYGKILDLKNKVNKNWNIIIIIYNSFLLSLLYLAKKKYIYIFSIIFNIIMIILKIIYIILIYIIEFINKLYSYKNFYKRKKTKSWYFISNLKNNTISKEYWDYIKFINFWNKNKKLMEYTEHIRVVSLIKKNKFVDLNMLLNYILNIIKGFKEWLFINIFYKIKNMNNYFFHNIIFFFYYNYWTHEFFILSLPIINQLFNSLYIFNYVNYNLIQQYLKRIVNNIWNLVLNSNFANEMRIEKKIKTKEYKYYQKKFYVLFMLFYYIDQMYSYVKIPYFDLRKDRYLDRILLAGRINTNIEILHILFWSIEKELSFRIDDIVSDFIKFYLKFYKKSNMLTEKPIFLMNYDLLTLLSEKKEYLLDNENKKNYFFKLKKYSYLLLLNNYFIYSVYLNFFKKYVILELYLKYVNILMFNIFNFLYFFYLNKKNIKIVFNFFYKIIWMIIKKIYVLKNNISIFRNILFINLNEKFISNLKYLLRYFIIINIIIVILNIDILEILIIINSIIIPEITKYIIYIYVFIFESIKYFIELICIENVLNFLGMNKFNILYMSGTYNNLNIDLDYKKYINCVKLILKNYARSTEVLYEILTFNPQVIWTQIYIPSNFLHAFFRLFFEFIFINVQPYWFFFLKYWDFNYYNVFSSKFLITWYPTLFTYVDNKSLLNCMVLNSIIVIWKLYFFFELILNYLNNLLLGILIIFCYLLEIILKYIYILIKYIILVNFWISFELWNIVNYIYIYIYIYKIIYFLKIILFNIFFGQVFLNIYLFCYNLFYYYSDQFYYLFDIEHISNYSNPLRERREEITVGVTIGSFGSNFFDNILITNKFNNELLFSYINQEWKNLNYFKTFFIEYKNLNSFLILFFIIIFFLLVKFFTYFFSLVNNWYYFIFFNNDNMFYFSPYLNWKNYRFLKKERNFHFLKEGKILDVPFIYLFGSYYDLDKYFFEKYKILSFEYAQFKMFKGRLRDTTEDGDWLDIGDVYMTRRKNYISNNHNYKIFSYKKYSEVLINNQKDFYFSYHLKSNYFFKNYQIFWFNFINNFLIQMSEQHGNHTIYEFRKILNWPNKKNKDKYNKLFGPIDVHYPLMNKSGENYIYGQDFIKENGWQRLVSEKLCEFEEKSLSVFNLKYKFKNLKNDIIIKEPILKYNLKYINKNLYFNNYLQFPFIFFITRLNKKMKLWDEFIYILPFNLKKEKNIYNNYFLLNKKIIDKYEAIPFTARFMAELNNLTFLKFIFFNAAYQNFIMFDDSNYKRNWSAEVTPEHFILNEFSNYHRYTKVKGLMEPSLVNLNLFEKFDTYNEIMQKYFLWLNKININYFKNYMIIYKKSSNNYNILDNKDLTLKIDQNVLDKEEYLKYKLLNNEFMYELSNLNNKEKVINFEEKIKFNFENFESMEFKEYYLVKIDVEYAFHYNQLNWAMSFVMFYFPLHYFIDEPSMGWELSNWYIYLPGLTYTNFFVEYSGIVNKNMVLVDFDPFTWGYLFIKDGLVYLNKFFNIKSSNDYGLFQFNLEYILQPFKTQMEMYSDLWEIDYKSNLSRLNCLDYDDEDIIDEELELPHESMIFHSIFKDLILNKPKFYNNDFKYFEFSFHWFSFKGLIYLQKKFNTIFNIYDDYLYYKLGGSNSYKKFGLFFDNKLQLNMLIDWMNSEIIKNSFYNYEINSSFEFLFQDNQKYNSMIWLERFFLKKKISKNFININLESLDFFGKCYNIFIKNRSTTIYDWWSCISSDKWNIHKYYFRETAAEKIKNIRMIHFKVNYDEIINYYDFKNINYKKTPINFLFFHNISIIWTIIKNYIFIKKNVMYIDNSYFFGNNNDIYWLFNWWVSNKEIFLDIFNTRKDNILFMASINWIIYILIHFSLFMFFFIFYYIFMHYSIFNKDLLDKKKKKSVKKYRKKIYNFN